ncbi:MAG: hypothetical protein HRT90_02235 [Candidatus Margulisbacteria bacterium]|nr:hypothetical protein [Candidatus Margulisiibacteriota bacterium]
MTQCDFRIEGQINDKKSVFHIYFNHASKEFAIFRYTTNTTTRTRLYFQKDSQKIYELMSHLLSEDASEVKEDTVVAEDNPAPEKNDFLAKIEKNAKILIRPGSSLLTRHFWPFCYPPSNRDGDYSISYNTVKNIFLLKNHTTSVNFIINIQDSNNPKVKFTKDRNQFFNATIEDLEKVSNILAHLAEQKHSQTTSQQQLSNPEESKTEATTQNNFPLTALNKYIADRNKGTEIEISHRIPSHKENPSFTITINFKEPVTIDFQTANGQISLNNDPVTNTWEVVKGNATKEYVESLISRFDIVVVQTQNTNPLTDEECASANQKPSAYEPKPVPNANAHYTAAPISDDKQFYEDFRQKVEDGTVKEWDLEQMELVKDKYLKFKTKCKDFSSCESYLRLIDRGDRLNDRCHPYIYLHDKRQNYRRLLGK